MSIISPESESDVRRSILEVFKNARWHAFALETALLGTGAPDVNAAHNGLEWWFECKFLKNLPKQFWTKNKPLRLTDRQMRPSQRVWHTKRWRAGNARSFYLVVIHEPDVVLPDKYLWFILPGDKSAEHLGRTWTASDLKHHALYRSTTRPTIEDLLRCLH